MPVGLCLCACGRQLKHVGFIAYIARDDENLSGAEWAASDWTDCIVTMENNTLDDSDRARGLWAQVFSRVLHRLFLSKVKLLFPNGLCN